jgi:hypothetical protein
VELFDSAYCTKLNQLPVPGPTLKELPGSFST